MKKSSNPGLFPWFPILAGTLGLALRCWLLSTTDLRGLLPEKHPANALTYILLAITLAVCFLGVRRAAPRAECNRLFPASYIAAAGTVLGAIGMGFYAFALQTDGFLSYVIPICGVLAAGALLFSVYCRLHGLRLNFVLRGSICVYLLFRTIACCRNWSTEPQLQLYFFELLATVFLLMAGYFRTALDMKTGDCRQYVFFSQAAIFCCCLSLPGRDWLFFLSAGIWMAADYCVLPIPESDV